MIRVQSEDFDVGAEMAAFCAGDPAVGAIASFLGTVRGGDAAGGVRAMTLEHYPGMTEAELARIEGDARDRWPLANVLVIHRHGRLLPGDRIVLVMTASSHREAAFDACRFIVDFLKTRAPFWKREETPNGDRWVEARADDEAALRQWGGPR